MSGRFDVERVGQSDWWELWYGARTDDGDAGRVHRTPAGYVAWGRGDVSSNLGTFPTLEEAVSALEANY